MVSHQQFSIVLELLQDILGCVTQILKCKIGSINFVFSITRDVKFADSIIDKMSSAKLVVFNIISQNRSILWFAISLQHHFY